MREQARRVKTLTGDILSQLPLAPSLRLLTCHSTLIFMRTLWQIFLYASTLVVSISNTYTYCFVLRPLLRIDFRYSPKVCYTTRIQHTTHSIQHLASSIHHIQYVHFMRFDILYNRPLNELHTHINKYIYTYVQCVCVVHGYPLFAHSVTFLCGQTLLHQIYGAYE